MAADEQRLLAQRLAEADSRGAWFRWLMLASALAAIAALLWAVRLLNQALSRSYRAETEQRSLAGRLDASLNSLSQGVGVFGPNHNLRHWNECFQVLLNLPKAMLREGTPYAAFVEHTADGDKAFLESEEQIRHGGEMANEPVVYEHTTKNGHQLEIRRTPVSEGGFALTISDMTRRAQAEGGLLDRAIDVRKHLVELAARYQRAHLRCIVQRRADPDRCGERCAMLHRNTCARGPM
jgi:PAS domain-containing protein